MKNLTFKYEYIEKMEDLRQQIRNCEGRHAQQVAFSTFHDALTQICYVCMKVRSTIRR